MQDLTDRRFLGLLEAAPDAMVCVEGDGRIALVNAQTERLFGYHREELIGQHVEILVPEDHARHAPGSASWVRRRSQAEAHGRRHGTGRAPP